ncbi:ATP synthase subunit atpD [Acrasis kona]|uniref:ATP synthase subunit atpD n=1 Tax=Acrasis kona TaxID=1008807 RepID=A0AAW2ZNT5_9EUKA
MEAYIHDKANMEIESQETSMDFRIVDPVQITQNQQQLRTKDFSFQNLKPYNLHPLTDSLFIEVTAVETTKIAVREVIGRTEDNSIIMRVTRGVLKKYKRQVFMLCVNGKQLLAQAHRGSIKKPRKLHFRID